MPSMQSNIDEQAHSLVEALKNPTDHPKVQAVVDRWQNASRTVKSKGKWRLEGFISFFQYFHELMNAVDPSLPDRLPPQCFDPESIAKLFNLPEDAFDDQRFEVENDSDHTERIATALERLADGLAPQSPDIVGTSHIAKRLGCTQVWITDLVRSGEIPRHCIVEGTGNGKPWKFHRKDIDRWLKNR